MRQLFVVVIFIFGAVLASAQGEPDKAAEIKLLRARLTQTASERLATLQRLAEFGREADEPARPFWEIAAKPFRRPWH